MSRRINNFYILTCSFGSYNTFKIEIRGIFINRKKAMIAQDKLLKRVKNDKEFHFNECKIMKCKRDHFYREDILNKFYKLKPRNHVKN